MNLTDKEKALEYARYYVQNETTIRSVARRFGVSKSYVHSVFSKMLEGWFVKEEEQQLVRQVKQLLVKNRIDAYKKGGQATKAMYKERKEAKVQGPLKITSINSEVVRKKEKVVVCKLSEEKAKELVLTEYSEKKNLAIEYVKLVDSTTYNQYEIGVTYDVNRVVVDGIVSASTRTVARAIINRRYIEQDNVVMHYFNAVSLGEYAFTLSYDKVE